MSTVTRPEWYGQFAYGQQTCPRCGSSNVAFGVTMTTAVGWMGGPDRDPNHHTQVCDCGGCGLHYTREWVVKHQKAWAAVGVDEGEVIYNSPVNTKYAIAGYPTCCASTYLIHCTCGGWAKNLQHHKMVSGSTVDGVWVMTPANIWECACGYRSPEMPQPVEMPAPTAFDRILKGGDEL